MERKLLVLSAAVTILLAGCVVAPVPVQSPYYSESVLVAPPPPRDEYIGPPPVTGYIWIGGFWNWSGGRHQWVRGHWEAPRPGYAWIPHRWEREGNHWRQYGGRWQDEREHRPRYHERDRRDQYR